MPYKDINTTEAWLLRNLRKQDATPGAASLMSSSNGYRVRVLRLMLAIAAVATAAMWYQEHNLHLMNVIDGAAYPVLLLVTTLGSLLLVIRPASLRVVLATVYTTLVVYLLADYYYILAYRMSIGYASSYELATVALWLPLGYVAGYVFFSPQVAMRTSLLIYAAVSLPQWVLLGSEANIVDRQIAIAMLISHPVYIAALWGVAQLKMHVSGVHLVAKSMSAAAAEDTLTGAANRRAMQHALQMATNALSGSDRPLALMMLDVDRFKGINDRFGHSVGDEVLITLVRQANVQLRGSDLLGRWGGEEFMILALDQTQTHALQMAERLRADLEQISYSLAGTVTVSIGVTTFIPGEAIDVFIKRADDALYLAKERGRNRVEGLFGSTPASV